MPNQILTSAIFRSRKQAIRNQGKLILGCLSTLQALVSLLFVSILMLPLSLHAHTGGDSLHSLAPVNSYILKEVGSPTLLMSKDIDRPVSPASLTKILTCTIAIESGKLEQDVLITKESTIVDPTKAGFKPGEKIKLIDLVKAAMVNSSNDAAFAIAIYLSGNVDAFVAAMNAKAKLIGMKNSRFTNPAGFDKGIYTGNTSTAGDLLRLTEYAVKSPVFNDIARLEKAVFTEQTTHKVYSLKTHNKLLDKYPYAVGIKTGFTTKAGGCLIARAIKNNKDMLLVILNAKTDRWNVAASMFDMAFLGSKPDPAWIVQSSHTDAGNTGISKANEQENVDTIVSKPVKRRHHLSRAALRSKRNTIALSKPSRKSKKAALALSTTNHKAKRKAQAITHIGKKSKKHQLAASRQTRKNKKRTTIS